MATQINLHPSAEFMERVQRYMALANIESPADAILELAAAGMLEVGILPDFDKFPVKNSHGGKRIGAGRKAKSTKRRNAAESE